MGVAALITWATLLSLTPQQKAAIVVVSGLPSPRGVGAVIVGRWNRSASRPAGVLVVTDQEGGAVKSFPELPPRTAASAVHNKADAYASARARGLAVTRAPPTERARFASSFHLLDRPVGLARRSRAAVPGDV
ncbi:MAG: hypothetical protein E6G03_12285 [Actinobacteria bacterium]|nr:MAG: hypothetical protein E6G03_12285 [Actinomycetota bacterium]